MTWFKVDDSFHSHPKVLAAEPAALGLWVVAGAWCSANLTDGFVPDYVLSRLLPGSAQLAAALATCGLWKRTKGGYRFHDWSVYQPTKDEATAAKDKKSSGGRLGNHRRWHAEKGVQDPNCDYCRDRSDVGTDAVPMGGPMPNRYENQAVRKRPGGNGRTAFAQHGAIAVSDIRSVTDRSTDSPPNRPDPTRPEGSGVKVVKEGESSVTRASQEPPRNCEKHLNDNNPPPCGSCADARKRHEAWQADRRSRLDASPHCPNPEHRGQLAGNCSVCRSELLATTGRTGAFPLIVPKAKAS